MIATYQPQPERSVPMKQYLLSIYQPDGRAAPARGRWSRSCATSTPCNAGDAGRRRLGLRRRAAPAEHGHRGARRRTATCCITDGPFAEGKEHIGGFTIIQAPDLDAALAWGRKLARRRPPLPIEVRPFQDGAGD